MFFDSVDEVQGIAQKNGTSIFVVPDVYAVEIKNTLVLQPESKVSITIEQVREMMGRLGVKQVTDQYVIIRPADQINIEAANALLKKLEEPNDKVHFVLLTSEPSKLLPTVLSRAAIYFMRRENSLSEISSQDEKIKAYAKRLIAVKDKDLVKIAEEITKTKQDKRAYVLEILGLTIEMLYKSYFITGREAFFQKIPKFLAAYDNISRNGHIKLHLVADLC